MVHNHSRDDSFCCSRTIVRYSKVRENGGYMRRDSPITVE